MKWGHFRFGLGGDPLLKPSRTELDIAVLLAMASGAERSINDIYNAAKYCTVPAGPIHRCIHASYAEVKATVARLVKAGKLVRTRRGFYKAVGE